MHLTESVSHKKIAAWSQRDRHSMKIPVNDVTNQACCKMQTLALSKFQSWKLPLQKIFSQNQNKQTYVYPSEQSSGGQMSKLTYKINGFWTQKRTKKISAATR